MAHNRRKRKRWGKNEIPFAWAKSGFGQLYKVGFETGLTWILTPPLASSLNMLFPLLKEPSQLHSRTNHPGALDSFLSSLLKMFDLASLLHCLFLPPDWIILDSIQRCYRTCDQKKKRISQTPHSSSHHVIQSQRIEILKKLPAQPKSPLASLKQLLSRSLTIFILLNLVVHFQLILLRSS